MEVVLVHPEIPQNTGSIARTCAATDTPLRLIEPLGFSLDEKRIRRAGLDYWPEVSLSVYQHWESYVQECRPRRTWAISKFGTRGYHQADFQSDDALIFGSETKGLGENFLQAFDEERILRIPMSNKNVRSLNLSNAVSIVLYHALLQTDSLPNSKLFP